MEAEFIGSEMVKQEKINAEIVKMRGRSGFDAITNRREVTLR